MGVELVSGVTLAFTELAKVEGARRVVVGDGSDTNNEAPQAFATSFVCPARLYFGDQEDLFEESTRDLAQRAKAVGLDVEAMAVPGDHRSMVESAIPMTLAFFLQRC